MVAGTRPASGLTIPAARTQTTATVMKRDHIAAESVPYASTGTGNFRSAQGMHMILADGTAHRADGAPGAIKRRVGFVQRSLTSSPPSPWRNHSSVESRPAFDLCRRLPGRVNARHARPLL